MQYGVFDIESRNWIDFVIGGFFDGKEYRTFSNVNALLDLLDHKRYAGFRFYAHNGGKFDFLFLLEELLKRGVVKKIIDRQGSLIMIRVETSRTHYSLCDSYALLPLSLRALGLSFDTLHKKEEIDYHTVSATSAKTLHYLENDVFCLYEILSAFFSSQYVTRPALTIAAQALATFRDKFMPFILKPMRLPEEDDLRRNWYSGGRVEVFKGYGEKLHAYDVNSLFPYAMIQPMPCGEVRRTRVFHKDKIGFYEIDVTRTPDNYLGLYLVKGEDKNYFVNGPGRYFLSSATINFLVKAFAIKYDVVRGYYFTGQGDLFGDYVSTFYAIKSEKKQMGSAEYVIAKLFLNALYGKFGMRRDYWSLRMWSEDLPSFSLPDSGILQGYGLVLVPEKSKSTFILPYIAAYITDLARAYHLSLMARHSESMYYCDTDSLYTTANYSDTVGKKLGQLSDEGTYTGVFLNAKCYALKGSGKELVHMKGFARESFRFSDYKRALLSGRKMVQKIEHVLSYKECLIRRADVKRKRGVFLQVADQVKEAVPTYDKRLTFKSKRHIFDSAPLTYKQISGGTP